MIVEFQCRCLYFTLLAEERVEGCLFEYFLIDVFLCSTFRDMVYLLVCEGNYLLTNIELS